MSHIVHHAIVVTSWNAEAIAAAADEARKTGLKVIGPGVRVLNGFMTFLVCPDGSKAGWPESDRSKQKRDKFIVYMKGVKYDDGSSCLDWVAVTYGTKEDGSPVFHAA
jgi:ABC-type sugar transport system substrate-binding protein